MPKKGSKQLILDFFLANIGRVLEGRDIRAASGGASEWARRVRKLRDEQGYCILTHKDRAELKPGQYLMPHAKRRPAFARGISKETRAWVLERNGYTCQMCGAAAGDPDPFHEGRTVRLTLGHIIDKSKGGSDQPSNLRAVCTACNEGLQNTAPPKPDLIHLLGQVRRARVDDQRKVLEWLMTKFGMPVPLLSRPRMGGVVGFLEAFAGDVGVDLRGGEAGVAEHGLHASQVGSGVEEMGGEAVS
jgi:hypothetical protein